MADYDSSFYSEIGSLYAVLDANHTKEPSLLFATASKKDDSTNFSSKL